MNPFKKAVSAFSPNCREAIRLQSAALERPLSLSQWIGLRIHLRLCVWCRRYGRQIRFLSRFAKDCDHDQTSGPGLPPEARDRIKHALEANRN
jgi:hypothetical protein